MFKMSDYTILPKTNCFGNAYSPCNFLVAVFEKCFHYRLSLCKSPTDLAQIPKNFQNFGNGLLKEGQWKLDFLGFCRRLVKL